MKSLRCCFLPLALIAWCVAGCASHSQKQSSQAASVQTPATTAKNITAPNVLTEAAAMPSARFEPDGWTSMFDGKTLQGWRETDFAGRGEVRVESGLMVFELGDPFTGANYTNPFPKMNYEIALDAMRVSGSDFFCGLTAPAGESFFSLIVGGWGGSLVGISSLDGMDASENETTKFFNFERGKWYRIRLRVTENRIQAWIDKEKIINVDTTGRKISLRPGDIELSKPFGIASWQTTAALRNIRMRKVEQAEK